MVLSGDLGEARQFVGIAVGISHPVQARKPYYTTVSTVLLTIEWE